VIGSTVSLHKLQITRDVTKSGDTRFAVFIFKERELCQAWFSTTGLKRVSVANGMMTVEDTSALSVALQMAIEWLAEQS
jgi:hypothetical protein